MRAHQVLPSRQEMARVTCQFTAKMPDLHPGNVNLHVIWLKENSHGNGSW